MVEYVALCCVICMSWLISNNNTSFPSFRGRLKTCRGVIFFNSMLGIKIVGILKVILVSEAEGSYHGSLDKSLNCK